ncbi:MULTISPECIES: M50 family metallopeptidase [unclassified Luteococcus]|uniref:M50 family metallopeptidase n=1 Tax=unclassified Luteococcus TaxID=2639923 RepID=UPI00313BD671
MSLVVTVLAAVGFFALIMASIALHEVGHLVPAKLFGVKVTQYFVGFGKNLWRIRRGETEYGIKLLPLGGYVRLIGMYPPERPGAAETRSPLARLADEAREVEYESITPADDGRLFYQKPVWQKIIIMAGGPLMNLVLAFVIMAGVNGLHGQYRAQLVADSVSQCVVPVTRAERTCQPGDPSSPAMRAGVRPGDRIVAFNGTPLRSWEELSELIRANRANPAALVVERDGQRVELPATPTILTGVRDRLDPARTVEAGFLGVTPRTELVRGGAVDTAQDLWLQTKQSVTALAAFPVKVWNVAADLVTGQKRDANGPISIIGASQVAGQIAGNQQLEAGDKVASWFSMLASVNLFVCLLNCVPLPPLDGGHIAGALYEALKRGLTRLLGRPDPGHVDTARMLPVAYAVGAFLAVAGLVLVLADLVTPIKLL